MIRTVEANLRALSFKDTPCSEKFSSALNYRIFEEPKDVMVSISSLGCIPGPLSFISRYYSGTNYWEGIGAGVKRLISISKH